MKTEVWKKVEVEVCFVRVFVPVRYEEEDMPNDFPFRKGDMWDITIDIDTGKIVDWPGPAAHVEMKVTDGGSYYLLGPDKSVVKAIEQDYVPHGVAPGSYGDYIEMDIEEDGTITGYRPNLDDFFQDRN